MKINPLTMIVGALCLVPQTTTALAAPRDEQGQIRRETRAGTVMSLRDIEQRVLPSMAGNQYLGPEYDPAMMAYRLKFIRDGRVTFVDVDARSGEVIRQSR